MVVESSFELEIGQSALAQEWLSAFKHLLPPGTAIVATAREVGPRLCQATFRVRLRHKTIVSVVTEPTLGQAIDGAAQSLLERVKGDRRKTLVLKRKRGWRLKQHLRFIPNQEVA